MDRQNPDARDHEPDWLSDIRRHGREIFAHEGLPTRRQEAWRFSDVASLSRSIDLPQRQAGCPAAMQCVTGVTGPAHRLVFVNRVFAPHLSSPGDLPEGAWLGSIDQAVSLWPDRVRDAIAAQPTGPARAFAALNAAQFCGGYALLLEPGTVLTSPVEILCLAEGSGARHLRNVVVAGPASAADILEIYDNDGGGWTNAVTSVTLANAANLRHAVVQAEGNGTFTGSTRVTLAGNSTYGAFNLAVGARVSRQDLHVTLAEPGASLAIHGMTCLAGDQESTFAPFVDHRAPGCQTREILNAVLDGRSHAVFLGTIAVQPGADRTDARQMNRTLLLGRGANVDSKPELEIYADDVKCGHGATVGALDETALFYLQSRGIDPAAARRMLVEAFAGEVIDAALLPDNLQAPLRAYLARRLGAPVPA